MLSALRSSYRSVESRELELQPIWNEGDDSAPDARTSTSGKRWYAWHLPPWHEVVDAIQQPRVQQWLCIAAAVLVVLVAGTVLAINSKPAVARQPTPALQQQDDVVRNQTAHSNTASGKPAASAATGPFPAEPWLAPSSSAPCAAGGAALGPEQPVTSPLNYRLLLALEEAHFVAGDASGAVAAGFRAAANITLAVHQATSCVRLHASNLTFSTITAGLVVAGSSEQQEGTLQQQQQQQPGQPGQPPICLCGTQPRCVVQNCATLFKADPGSDSWLLSLGPLAAPAGATLLLATTYTAHFSDRQGVWRSSPFTPAATGPAAAGGAGQQQVLVSTQFENSTARTLFPCLDEPQYKATVVVMVEAPSHLTILSNMPEAERHSSSSERVVVEFLPSPPMSTYLVSIAVGDMQPVTANTTRHQLVRVWSPRVAGWQEASAVPLKLAVAALEHYEAYTQVPQSLAKFDLVAVPGKTGAVENWGLLLFDVERFLLTRPGAWALARCADVICHELAHQWYGNLVTAASWPDLLVNEGLASLAEYGCLAEVLQRQLGQLGAAAVMKQLVAPHGRAAGVHEGPVSKALEYDALPTADPLLGSGHVDFGVIPYSKAAAVMGMLAVYAATATSEDAGHQAAMAYGPVPGLMSSQPAGQLQAALQQYLRGHIYGTASAQDVLGLFVGLTPDPMSGSALAVLTGWRAPGSPLISLTHTAQGWQVSQRRFCSGGVLEESFTEQLLATKLSSGSSAAVPTPPLAPNAAPSTGTLPGVTPGVPAGLLCPLHADGEERSIPWTPVFLSQLPGSSAGNQPSSRSGNASASPDQAAADGASSEGGDAEGAAGDGGSSGGSTPCGSWHVIMRDQQLLDLPASGPCAVDTTAGGKTSNSLFVLEGEGGWGVHWSLYPSADRAAMRDWVSHQLLPLLSQQQGGSQAAAAAAATTGQQVEGPDNSHLLFVASKLLLDQATLGLSAFGEVPGWEVVAALQAAAHTTAAAATAAAADSFGVMLYTLLSPLLPLADVLMDRLVVNATCLVAVQAELAAALRPVALAALQAFATKTANTTTATSSSDSRTGSFSSGDMLYTSPNQFLGAMSLSRLLVTASLSDPAVAGLLCKQFNAYVTAAATSSDGSQTVAGAELLDGLHPDMQDAVLKMAAAAPSGCNLNMPGAQLLALLQRWYLTSVYPSLCQLAAFALAHAATGLPAPAEPVTESSRAGAAASHAADASPSHWTQILALLLGMGPLETPGQLPPVAARPACGIPPSAHAVELAKIVSRGLTLQQVRQAAVVASVQPRDRGVQLGPVMQFMMHNWQQAVAALGHDTAQRVVEEVAAQEVVTVQQWQQLAAWAVQQQQQQQDGPEAERAQQRKKLQSLLGMAWSSVVWVAANTEAVCSRLS